MLPCQQRVYLVSSILCFITLCEVILRNSLGHSPENQHGLVSRIHISDKMSRDRRQSKTILFKFIRINSIPKREIIHLCLKSFCSIYIAICSNKLIICIIIITTEEPHGNRIVFTYLVDVIKHVSVIILCRL
jgi:hypothetical protein